MVYSSQHQLSVFLPARCNEKSTLTVCVRDATDLACHYKVAIAVPIQGQYFYGEKKVILGRQTTYIVQSEVEYTETMHEN